MTLILQRVVRHLVCGCKKVRTNKHNHLRHRLQSRDKQPIEISFLKKCLEPRWPIAFLLAALSVTDSQKLIGPRRASGFRSPAHLPAVYLEAGASVKWQTVPEISFNKSLACSPSPPVPLLFLQARNREKKKTYTLHTGIAHCSHVCQDDTVLL